MSTEPTSFSAEYESYPPSAEFAEKGKESDEAPKGTQCKIDGRIDCPHDTCNYGKCVDGCAQTYCTKMACPVQNGGVKQEDELCSLWRNNCDKGLKCIEEDDGCEGNDVGRCGVVPSPSGNGTIEKSEQTEEENEIDLNLNIDIDGQEIKQIHIPILPFANKDTGTGRSLNSPHPQWCCFCDGCCSDPVKSGCNGP